jgi:transposase-like protein
MRKVGAFFRCSAPCGSKLSLKYGSIFFDSRLPLAVWNEFIELWILNVCLKDIASRLAISLNTASSLAKTLRAKITKYIQSHDHGAIGGEGKTVEIDETVITKRKYQKGRKIKETWLFGGIERGSGKFFIVQVKNRGKSELLTAIKQHILPGTAIFSDEWASYKCLAKHGYLHSTVCHKREFVAKSDPSVHTQNVENLWMRLKRVLKAKGTNLGKDLPQYLHEARFRLTYRSALRETLYLACAAE